MKAKLFCTAALLTLSSIAVAASSKGNWTGSFLIGPNHSTATHTPDRVCFTFLCAGSTLRLAGSQVNGMVISSTCPLELKVDSTKEEFVAALRCSGFDPIEQ